MFWPPPRKNVTLFANYHIMKDERLVSKMEGKTNFSRRLKQFDGLTWLTMTPIFYDRSTPLQQLADAFLQTTVQSIYRNLVNDRHTEHLYSTLIWRPVLQDIHSKPVSLSPFNCHFPGGLGLAGTGTSPFWISLELRMTEVALTTGACMTCKAPVKSSPPTNQHPVFLQAGMPFLSPNQQCQSTEEKQISECQNILSLLQQKMAPRTSNTCIWSVSMPILVLLPARCAYLPINSQIT